MKKWLKPKEKLLSISLPLGDNQLQQVLVRAWYKFLEELIDLKLRMGERTSNFEMLFTIILSMKKKISQVIT